MSEKATPTIKKCPFCGSEVDLMTLFTGMKMFYCRNHAGCGAIVSFDNKKCNYEKGDAEKIKADKDSLEKVNRVIVEDGKMWCKQFYQDAQPEPCEDAVSRKAVQYLLAHFVDEDKYIDACDGLKHLPPVTPKQRTGKWIDGIIPNDGGGLPVIVCDQCNTFFPLQFGDGHNFCPNCGAKMEGGAE